VPSPFTLPLYRPTVPLHLVPPQAGTRNHPHLCRTQVFGRPGPAQKFFLKSFLSREVENLRRLLRASSGGCETRSAKMILPASDPPSNSLLHHSRGSYMYAT
jgi:hypothetical protein